MRIICDHCSQPMYGTVKRVTGNFNLHPDCLAQLDRQAKHESTKVAWQSQEPAVSVFGDWKATVTGTSRAI